MHSLFKKYIYLSQQISISKLNALCLWCSKILNINNLRLISSRPKVLFQRHSLCCHPCFYVCYFQTRNICISSRYKPFMQIKIISSYELAFLVSGESIICMFMTIQVSQCLVMESQTKWSGKFFDLELSDPKALLSSWFQNNAVFVSIYLSGYCFSFPCSFVKNNAFKAKFYSFIQSFIKF